MTRRDTPCVTPRVQILLSLQHGRAWGVRAFGASEGEGPRHRRGSRVTPISERGKGTAGYSLGKAANVPADARKPRVTQPGSRWACDPMNKRPGARAASRRRTRCELAGGPPCGRPCDRMAGTYCLSDGDATRQVIRHATRWSDRSERMQRRDKRPRKRPDGRKTGSRPCRPIGCAQRGTLRPCMRPDAAGYVTDRRGASGAAPHDAGCNPIEMDSSSVM